MLNREQVEYLIEQEIKRIRETLALYEDNSHGLLHIMIADDHYWANQYTEDSKLTIDIWREENDLSDSTDD